MIQLMSSTVHTWEEDEKGSNVAWEFELGIKKTALSAWLNQVEFH